MANVVVPGKDAWTALIRSDHGRWQSDLERFSQDLALVAHEPKFLLAPDDAFFCIGSCFARNVEEHLIYGGRKVLSKRIVSPLEEWPSRINGFVNKFTTSSMLNEIEWTAEPPTIDESLFEETPQGWVDLQLCPGVRPVTLQRAIERRCYLLRDYFSRLRDASVVILTLGLNEVWRDARSGRYLNAPPSFYSVRRDPGRYFAEILDVDANVEALENIRATLLRMQPSVRIIVTVSPVPLGETFSGKDVAVANTLSKATLRVAADVFARRHGTVDYFPTFDMVSLSPRHLAYEPDCVHVTDQVVAKIMQQFLRLYMQQESAPTPFNEVAYLAANPDVAAAARLGQYESGYEHWLQRGRAEGRPLLAGDKRVEIRLARETLERYVGRYRLTTGVVVVVTCDAEHLIAHAATVPRIEFFAESEVEFFARAFEMQLAFDVDSQGCATALVVTESGRRLSGTRIDAMGAPQLEQTAG